MTIFSSCEIKYEDVLIPFQIILNDAAKECSPKCNLNFVKFIWKYLAAVKFKMYAIVAVPFDTPNKILYLKHYMANSEGWVTYSLCDVCFEVFKEYSYQSYLIAASGYRANAISVFSNLPLSGAWHHRQFFISRAMSHNSD
jgi:hypothetical protein